MALDAGDREHEVGIKVLGLRDAPDKRLGFGRRRQFSPMARAKARIGSDRRRGQTCRPRDRCRSGRSSGIGAWRRYRRYRADVRHACVVYRDREAATALPVSRADGIGYHHQGCR